MQHRRIPIALSIVILAVLGLGGWQWWQWLHPHIALDPQAKINMERTYLIDVWVEMDDSIVDPPSLDDQFWSDLVAEFQSIYPNVHISLVKVAKADLDQRMQDALAKGRPPHILVASSKWFRLWSDLQLPIDRFMSETERQQVFPFALARVMVGENLMAWPCQIQPNLWAGSRPRLKQLAGEEALLHAVLGEGGNWFLDDWQNLRDRLKPLRDLRQYPIAHQQGASETLLDVLVAASQGVVGQNGELLLRAELVGKVLNEWQMMQSEKFMLLTQGSLLTDFLSGKRAMIGPVGLWFWSLGEKAKKRANWALKVPQDLVLLPGPGWSGSGGYMSGKMVDIAVFRHRRFQGQAHARLSMEFAKELSQKLGLEMSRTGLGIPADRGELDTWQSLVGWTPQQRANLEEVLGLSSGLPPLTPKWHEARRQLIYRILKQGLDDFVNGKAGLEIADRLETDMRLFLEAIRTPPPKGKRSQTRISP
ncbi:MAG: hypothetical protein GX354_09940 [Firmicutes bacterium]|nr:hypothetical protein [Bacillota bacterium]